jgi:predicted enzyme related to lactoylglutathione lyase
MTADLGGAVASGPMTTRHGRFAILEDPGSAMFAVFEPITH